ncbi:MAG: thioredoxin family protein [Methanoculleus sp.]|jgi:small redox-active disulfide protein 2|nr:thioredoxin family protein [Methanoculleus sp.]
MKVEILGTGCAKCKRLTKNAEAAIKELGIEAELVKVDDITEIMDRGVMLTPALAVDGELKVSGRVADVKEIKEILQG